MFSGSDGCSAGCEFNTQLGECVCPEHAQTYSESCDINSRTGKCKKLGGRGGCFPGSAQVMLQDGGRKEMKDLQVGEVVLTGSGHFLPILGWLDINHNMPTDFVRIFTNQSSSLSLTGSHVIFRHSGKHGRQEPIFTRDLNVGDIIVHEASGNKAKISQAFAVLVQFIG